MVLDTEDLMFQPFGCSVEATLSVIGGRWKPVIMFKLMDAGMLRFNEIRRQVPDVTQKMLTNQLRELEADGIIERRVYAEVPPRVEYRLTDYGRTLKPILIAMKDWGIQHMAARIQPADSPAATTPARQATSAR